MSFTRDDLKDGMVCMMRSGKDYVVGGVWLYSVEIDPAEEYSYEAVEHLTGELKFIGVVDPDKDIMKITYGGKTVFEREEWRELTIDEAFELLKSGAVLGQAYSANLSIWATLELRALAPFSEDAFYGSTSSYRKFRIKK